jgi:uncharacterized membrane protein YfcA
MTAVAETAWWIWPLALFAMSFAIGTVAVLSGVGGGVLFVPIVSGFFPFHIDFVRAAGLLLAMAGALSAGPALLRSGMASLRLAMPFALVGSVTSIFGAILGLTLSTGAIQIALGLTILGVAWIMWRGAATSSAGAVREDRLAMALGMHGMYRDPSEGTDVPWRVHRSPSALVAFAGIGVLAGMFGLGAGWANVAGLNLWMGAPLKLAVGTSGFIVAVVDSSAAWVYLQRGAVLPMLVVPSIVGVMLGAKIGARLLGVAPTRTVRRLVILLLSLAGLRALLKGAGVWP